jgi:hypothetical protein
MSDEDFLARWSRRKQEAGAGQAVPRPEEPVQAQHAAPSAGATEEPVNREPDLSNLPPIDSIDEATDITVFLRKGIPQELSRAALRRAWSTDPAIRDFAGLAENAWDFNDPNAMPGFGPLDYTAEQVDALVRRIVGEVAQAAENLPDPLAETANSEQAASAGAELAHASDPVEAIADSRLSSESSAEPHSGSAASQPEIAAQRESVDIPVRRRTHGGALPK